VLENRAWLHKGKKSRHENLQSKSIYLTDGKNNREETSLHTNETKEKLRSEVNTTHDAKTIFPEKSNESLSTTEVTALPPSFDWN
jgi:hypothetical protein